MLDLHDSPPVISLILFNKNGVILAPEIFYSSASFRDYVIASLIFSPFAYYSEGTGTVIKIPVLRFK